MKFLFILGFVSLCYAQIPFPVPQNINWKPAFPTPLSKDPLFSVTYHQTLGKWYVCGAAGSLLEFTAPNTIEYLPPPQAGNYFSIKYIPTTDDNPQDSLLLSVFRDNYFNNCSATNSCNGLSSVDKNNWGVFSPAIMGNVITPNGANGFSLYGTSSLFDGQVYVYRQAWSQVLLEDLTEGYYAYSMNYDGSLVILALLKETSTFAPDVPNTPIKLLQTSNDANPLDPGSWTVIPLVFNEKNVTSALLCSVQTADMFYGLFDNNYVVQHVEGSWKSIAMLNSTIPQGYENAEFINFKCNENGVFVAYTLFFALESTNNGADWQTIPLLTLDYSSHSFLIGMDVDPDGNFLLVGFNGVMFYRNATTWASVGNPITTGRASNAAFNPGTNTIITVGYDTVSQQGQSVVFNGTAPNGNGPYQISAVKAQRIATSPNLPICVAGCITNATITECSFSFSSDGVTYTAPTTFQYDAVLSDLIFTNNNYGYITTFTYNNLTNFQSKLVQCTGNTPTQMHCDDDINASNVNCYQLAFVNQFNGGPLLCAADGGLYQRPTPFINLGWTPVANFPACTKCRAIASDSQATVLVVCVCPGSEEWALVQSLDVGASWKIVGAIYQWPGKYLYGISKLILPRLWYNSDIFYFTFPNPPFTGHLGLSDYHSFGFLYTSSTNGSHWGTMDIGFPFQIQSFAYNTDQTETIAVDTWGTIWRTTEKIKVIDTVGTPLPTYIPTSVPTAIPTPSPSAQPTPTLLPTPIPTISPWVPPGPAKTRDNPPLGWGDGVVLSLTVSGVILCCVITLCCGGIITMCIRAQKKQSQHSSAAHNSLLSQDAASQYQV